MAKKHFHVELHYHLKSGQVVPKDFHLHCEETELLNKIDDVVSAVYSLGYLRIKDTYTPIERTEKIVINLKETKS